MGITLSELRIPGVFLITPPKFGDDRGFFSETYNANALAEVGIDAAFVQDNQSLSAAAGVLRGLHFQAPPHAQAKLVRVLRGSIYDVAVDIRKGSPTYGEWVGAELSAENWTQIFVPRGFAHGFVTLEPMTEVQYKVDGFYDQPSDGGLPWDDADIGIDWPFKGELTLSDKDKIHKPLAEFDSPFSYDG